jgi:hypothetical protein
MIVGPTNIVIRKCINTLSNKKCERYHLIHCNDRILPLKQCVDLDKNDL